MNIQIRGDRRIEKYHHAVIVYDDKRKETILLGESRGMVYLGEEAVYTPRELHPHATIEIGQTKLSFVPFCGKNFCWQENDGE